MTAPRAAVGQMEAEAPLPKGDYECFAGYAVLGLSFRPGNRLAMRRFPG